jgi:RNA polymerase sigma-70 factor (ECF subfamily)
LSHSYQHTDQELLGQMAIGSELAFSSLYKRYWDKAYVTAARKLDDKELAKEIVHDIFLDLWKRRQELVITHFSAYLNKAVNYRIINALIQRKDNFFFDLLDNPQQSFYEADLAIREKELIDLVSSWIEVLPEKRREIFVKYYFQHLTTEEIASSMQISRKTVQNQLSLSIQYLRAHYGHLLSLVILLESISPKK